MQDPIIYLHIPKTAGTSFRISAEKYFGEANILRDYGADSNTTSSDILESFYQRDDLESLRKIGLSKKLLCGHFSLPRYLEIFPDSPVMTFFREPVKRVISEFVHFTNHYGYTGTLEEFYRNPNFQNRQQRVLGDAKPADLDFFGLTEQYNKSLIMFNQRYRTNLRHFDINKGNYGPASVVQPTAEQLEEISQLNKADHALYKLALKHFDNQTYQPKTASDITPRYRGNLGGIRENKLCGWVVDARTRAPTRLSVAVNGIVIITTTADENRPDVIRNGIDTDGHCGFAVPLNKLGPLKERDKISIITEDGLFELPNSPLTLAA